MYTVLLSYFIITVHIRIKSDELVHGKNICTTDYLCLIFFCYFAMILRFRIPFITSYDSLATLSSKESKEIV